VSWRCSRQDRRFLLSCSRWCSANRRVKWPDTKTAGMSKAMSAETVRPFETALRLEESPYVCPSIFDPNLPMSKDTYYDGWRRILARVGLSHVGTHGIRHRSATDIANSGIPVKIGIVLTAHKTVTMFMRYVQTEDNPVRAAADALASAPTPDPDWGRRGCSGSEPAHETILAPPSIAPELVGGEFRHPTNPPPTGRFGETQPLQTAVGNGKNWPIADRPLKVTRLDFSVSQPSLLRSVGVPFESRKKPSQSLRIEQLRGKIGESVSLQRLRSCWPSSVFRVLVARGILRPLLHLPQQETS
jgi:hypothetical protein